MSLLSRIGNAFRPDRVNRDLDEELQSHLDEAAEHGRDPAEARRAFGSVLRQREASREFKLVTWLDALRSDVVFGWRQLLKHKIPSAAAVLSLALAIGACVSAFRLVDALLLRPLPFASPERLFVLTYEFTSHTGKIESMDSFAYPNFRRLRAAVKGAAELMAISYPGRINLTHSAGGEVESAYRQYVSGWTFHTLGLKPAAGRLLSANDDVKPGAHPHAVISYDYWRRRFGLDHQVVGRSFRIGDGLYEIVGVVERGFTGTETGTFTDIFIPVMMNAQSIENPNWGWFRTWVQPVPGARVEGVLEKLQASTKAFREEKAKSMTSQSKAATDRYINAPLRLESASAGVSFTQKDYRQALAILSALVALVLMIACVNVANLKTAQAAARAREMALRVSIGAGRGRLLQLVLVESVLVALLASGLGGLFAWAAAPLVVNAINPPDDPARLALPADWRVMGFAILLALGVTLLFGLMPALRASAVKPVNALKGGDDSRGRRRLMNVMVAAQVAFCILVQFAAGLFITTFDRLSQQSPGFAAERLLLLGVSSKAKTPAAAHWDQVVNRLRAQPGVESAAIASWPLMSNNIWTSALLVKGVLHEETQPYLLPVSPGWLATMRIPMIGGRDFRQGDVYPKAAIVNESFAKAYFNGRDPVGESFELPMDGVKRSRVEIVGCVRDARYLNMREPIRPIAYLPFRDSLGGMDQGTLIVRTVSADPLSMAQVLRVEVPRARSEFRVTNVRTQAELVRSHTVRERLLAMLALFFAVVALLLAGVGLFGVLDYSVQQRRREIGIRMALGARSFDVARRVTVEVFSMVLIGGAAGLAAGVASERYLETLLYQVKATDVTMLTLPAVTIFAAAVLAALPPVIRAVRIDPARMLRAD